MSLQAHIDPVDSGRLIFSLPLNLTEATQYLWAKPPAKSTVLRPDPSEHAHHGRQHRFLIDTSDMDVLLSLQHGLGNEYVKRIKPIPVAGKFELPGWLTPAARAAIISNKLPTGATRFPGHAPWGDIVVWRSRSSIQMWRYFPDGMDFYLSLAHGDKDTARTLHDFYVQFNRDMKEFIEDRGLDPDNARSEVRRVNEEVFKLVIEGVVGVMAAGSAMSGMHNIMRHTAERVVQTAERTGYLSTKRAAQVAEGFVQRVKKAVGRVVVNIGGAGEEAEAINVNPNSGMSRKRIPNLVQASAEELGELFERGTVDEIVSNRLPHRVILWRPTLEGAARVLRPGGKIFIRMYGAGEDTKVIVPLLKELGFRDIQDIGGVVIQAIR